MWRQTICGALLGAVVAVIASPAAAQGSGTFSGTTQCFINGQFVTVRGNCPASSGGGRAGAPTGINPAITGGLYQGGYQLGYALGQFLFGSSDDPQAEAQKRLMMEELRRREAEAERQHREEEARRIAAMYNRLAATLKLSGLPQLQIKMAGGDSELKLKLGEGGDGSAGEGVKGLPGIYLNDDKAPPYGIPGLPGVYTGGPGEETRLGLKLGGGDGGAVPPAAPPTSAPPAPGTGGLALKVGGGAAPATMDPAQMTPQQLADVAEMVSKMPPDEQRRVLDFHAGQIPSSARHQAAASQAALQASTPEAAAAQARAGFDQPQGPPTVPALGAPGITSASRPGKPPPAAPANGPVSSLTDELLKRYLFPGEAKAGPFPRNPEPTLDNPLRRERSLDATLAEWDDWARRQTAHAHDQSDALYPIATVEKELNAGVVRTRAPDLLDRYQSDPAFRQDLDARLRVNRDRAVADYYQGVAEAHKASLRAFQAELDKLAAAGKLDRLTPLEEQVRQHPERRRLVQAAWDRVAARGEAAADQTKAVALRRLDQDDQTVFDAVRAAPAR